MNWLNFNWWKLTHPRRNSQRKDVISYAAKHGLDTTDSDIREITQFLRKNPIDIFPYSFRSEFFSNIGSAEFDAEKNLHYVDHNGRRLYWQAERKSKRIPRDYASLLSEQHSQSPHRYLSSEFNVGEDDVIADIGCGEANFTLDVIDRVRHAYLFESNPQWAKALEATFEPWRDKVTIIPSMVGSKSTHTTVSLDDYFSDKLPPTFLKLDVEGCEADVLQGCQNIISNANTLKAAVCTYHRQEDEEDLTNLLTKLGFSVRPSQGYMLLHRSSDFAEPYFRRGIVRATIHR